MATRGRPPWKPTPAVRYQVSAAAAGGMSHEHIAAALGISADTLKKHCADELTAGAALRRMRSLGALYRQAEKGNVSACKAVLAFEAARLGAGAGAGAGDGKGAGETAAGPTPPAPAPARAVRLGKKEVAQLEAGSAEQGSPWEGTLPTFGAKPPVQ